MPEGDLVETVLAHPEDPQFTILDRVEAAYLCVAAEARRRDKEYPLPQFIADLIKWGSSDEEPVNRLGYVLRLSRGSFGAQDEGVSYLKGIFAEYSRRLEELLQITRQQTKDGVISRLAQLNQRHSIGLFNNLQGKWDEDTQSFIQIVESFARCSIEGSDRFWQFLDGVWVQAGLMKVLSDNDYKVIPLDYNDFDDIVIFDRRGVDFIAVHPSGVVFLTDSKGNLVHSEGAVNRVRPEVTFVENRIFPAGFRKMQEKLQKKKVNQVTGNGIAITIRVRGAVGRTVSREGEIVDEGLKEDIISGLDKIIKERTRRYA